MAVYVDNMRAIYGRMKMCHMIADSSDELMAMADRIGVDRRWIQKAGTAHEHFDIALSKRGLAVAAGAVEVSKMDLGRILRRRRACRENDPAIATLKAENGPVPICRDCGRHVRLTAFAGGDDFACASCGGDHWHYDNKTPAPRAEGGRE